MDGRQFLGLPLHERRQASRTLVALRSPGLRHAHRRARVADALLPPLERAAASDPSADVDRLFDPLWEAHLRAERARQVAELSRAS